MSRLRIRDRSGIVLGKFLSSAFNRVQVGEIQFKKFSLLPGLRFEVVDGLFSLLLIPGGNIYPGIMLEESL
jgi:hypothetical protein